MTFSETKQSFRFERERERETVWLTTIAGASDDGSSIKQAILVSLHEKNIISQMNRFSISMIET